MTTPYNPLDKHNLGKSVADALLKAPVSPLAETKEVIGAGVYALYYTGSFAAYSPIALLNRNIKFLQPIYVGKAVPAGARKGGIADPGAISRSLAARLRDHAKSIRQADNLDLDDFHFRSLTVDDIWIPLGENMLIEQFQPLWNRVIDGFGNKTPGVRRKDQKRSCWDALHPGRSFVRNLGLAEHELTPAQIELRIQQFFSGELPEDEKILATD